MRKIFVLCLGIATLAVFAGGCATSEEHGSQTTPNKVQNPDAGNVPGEMMPPKNNGVPPGESNPRLPRPNDGASGPNSPPIQGP